MNSFKPKSLLLCLILIFGVFTQQNLSALSELSGVDVSHCDTLEIAQNEDPSVTQPPAPAQEREIMKEPAQPEEPKDEEDTKTSPFKKFSPSKKIPAEQAVDFPVDI
jgi:hypothetical protein